MIPWGDINTVFLDMDGTLLDLNFDNHFWLEHVPQRYAEARGLEPAAAKAELLARYRSREGTLEWYCVDHWSRELGLDIALLKEEVHHLIAVHPHVLDFLTAVRATGLRVVLVTNADLRESDIQTWNRVPAMAVFGGRLFAGTSTCHGNAAARAIRAALADGIARVIVAELNHGQYRREIERVAGAIEVTGIHRVDGELIEPEQFIAAFHGEEVAK